MSIAGLNPLANLITEALNVNCDVSCFIPHHRTQRWLLWLAALLPFIKQLIQHQTLQCMCHQIARYLMHNTVMLQTTRMPKVGQLKVLSVSFQLNPLEGLSRNALKTASLKYYYLFRFNTFPILCAKHDVYASVWSIRFSKNLSIWR